MAREDDKKQKRMRAVSIIQKPVLFFLSLQLLIKIWQHSPSQLTTRVTRSVTCHFPFLNRQASNNLKRRAWPQLVRSKMESKPFVSVTFLTVTLFLGGAIRSGICRSEERRMEHVRLGGVHDLPGNQNSGEIESLARFAIQEHNNKEVFNSSV